MQKESTNQKRILVITVVFLLWAVGLHLLMVIGGRTDDTYFRDIGSAANFTYIKWIQDMWFGWSSRLIINCLCVFFAVMPHIFWRVTNVMLIAAVPLLLWEMADMRTEDKEGGALLACTLFIMMPYIITGEAGWIATSVNYVLPATCLLVCIYFLWKTAHRKKISLLEGVGYFVAACIATDAEQGAFCMMAVFLMFSLWMFLTKQKKYRTAIYALTLFSLLRMAMVLFCPGNIERKGLVIKENYPEFGKMIFFDKLRAGIYSVTSDMFLTFFSITFIMLLLILVLVWKKHKEWYKRAVAVIPFAFTFIIPAAVVTLVYKDYGAAALGVRSWSSSAENVLIMLGISGNTNFLWDKLPLVYYYVAVCIFICIFLSIWWIMSENQRYITELAFLLGCCTKGAMGFTGTVWYSHSRTGYYMVLAEMYVILQLFVNWKRMENVRLQKLYLYSTVFLALLNSFVSYGTVLLYAKG